MLIGKQIKNLWRFFGGMNAYSDSNQSDVVSMVNRKNPMYYLSNVMIIIMILIFISLFVDNFFEKENLLLIFFISLLCFCFLLYFLIRIKEGDTVIAMEDGIKELNWLFSRFIKWDDVTKVSFYPEGELSKKLPWLKIYYDIIWTNIKVKGSRKTIRVSTKFSNNEQLQEYIRSKCRGKTEEHKYEPLYNLIIMIAVIVSALFLYVFRPFRELIEWVIKEF